MTQPTGQVGLATGHTSEYFYYAQGSNGVWDAHNGALLSKTGSVSPAVEGGVNVVVSDGSTYYSLPSALTLSGTWSLFLKVRSNGGVSIGDTSSPNDFVAVETTETKIRAGDQERVTSLSNGTGYNRYGFVADGTTLKAYKNGSLYATYTGLTSPIAFTLRSILAGYSGAQYSITGAIEYVHAIPGVALSDSQVAALDADPYSVLDVGADTTAPTLSAASATSIGPTTVTGNVTTDENNGTLYSVVSTSATPPSVAQIQAGQNNTGAAAVWSGNQSVSSIGAKNFSITGLANSTAYYAYFQHKDAAGNNSTVVSSAQFTTTSPPTITITDLKDLTTGTLRANETDVTAIINNVTTGALVVKLTGLTSTAGGDMSISDASMAASTQYRVTIILSDGSEGTGKYTAA